MSSVHVGGDAYGMQLKHIRRFVKYTEEFDGELNVEVGACIRTTSPEGTVPHWLHVAQPRQEGTP